MQIVTPEKVKEVLNGLADMVTQGTLNTADVSLTKDAEGYMVTAFIDAGGATGEIQTEVSGGKRLSTRALYMLMVVHVEESRAGTAAGTMCGSGVPIGRFWRSDPAHAAALEQLKALDMLTSLTPGQVCTTSKGRRVLQTMINAARAEEEAAC